MVVLVVLSFFIGSAMADADPQYKAVKGIVLKNGDVIDGQIISMTPDRVRIRTKEGKISSYNFREEVQGFIKDEVTVIKTPEKQPQPSIENDSLSTVADPQYKAVRGIVLKNGDVIDGQIISMTPDRVRIRTKEGKISSYNFSEEVQGVIKDDQRYKGIAAPTEEKPHRIEASVSYEYLSPHETYGDWNAANIAFYSKVSPTFTYFIEGSVANRLEGNGAAGTVGAYKDWTSFLYTYTAVSAGTYTPYLPKFRIDHDFNFKLGANKNYVLTAGITYIDYFTDHRDFIVSGGPTFYWNRWVLQYRLFHNESNPGSVESYSHLISVGYGEDGWQWTYLNVSFGKQAYLATSLDTPEAVNNDSLNITLQHRHWLGKHYGIFGEASYFKLEEGYEKYGINCGIFYEF